MGGIAVVAAAAVMHGAAMPVVPAGDATAVTAAVAAALMPRAHVSLVLPVGLSAGSVATTVAVRSVSLMAGASRCCVPGSL